VNVKLMKSGGISETIRIVHTARALGLRVMIGCFAETSLSITAGAVLGSLFDHIDLDSQLNLQADPFRGVEYKDGCLYLPDVEGIGARRA
ncbi:MAG: enolase C-terminal domain-like protein, partial [Candidatus Caldarchaeum sp.]